MQHVAFYHVTCICIHHATCFYHLTLMYPECFYHVIVMFLSCDLYVSIMWPVFIYHVTCMYLFCDLLLLSCDMYVYIMWHVCIYTVTCMYISCDYTLTRLPGVIISTFFTTDFPPYGPCFNNVLQKHVLTNIFRPTSLKHASVRENC